MARIPPLHPKQWPAEVVAALSAIDPTTRGLPAPNRDGRPSGRDAIASLARHPELAKAFLPFNGYALLDTELPIREVEILILRVAARRQSRYLWGQHIFAGRAAGLTDEEIARVAYGPNAPFLPPLDSVLLRAVDELIDDGVISDDTWSALATELDERRLLDILFVTGCYETMAWVMNSLDLEPDPRIPEYLKILPLP
ncbi:MULTISPECIES: carboxymuconolactone decarboxylase family protein [Pseudofrankia]|uniref:carboxymuconolactone decarboxylase family protein n=1 Tax=Pseudofrankia TaxID=2994363 RepID=UPI000234BCC0|nr:MULTISPECIES: carboxymuconolactone decarboxylase family protein [Pseudofrankia]OHV41611.1 carboxymuconolactone decarboxylase [Pseudofrankia sp. EUN1h]